MQQVTGHNVLTNCKWLVSVWLTNYAPCCPAPDLNNILYVTVTSNNTAHCHHTARGQLGTDKIIYIFEDIIHCLLYLHNCNALLLQKAKLVESGLHIPIMFCNTVIIANIIHYNFLPDRILCFYLSRKTYFVCNL